jgi:Family of unknown function (DUF5990)
MAGIRPRAGHPRLQGGVRDPAGARAVRRRASEQVRREGPLRRFVYIAIGKQAGDRASAWDRRMKVDIHTLGQPLLDQALTGKILELAIAGTGPDGTPACATVTPLRPWRCVRRAR